MAVTGQSFYTMSVPVTEGEEVVLQEVVEPVTYLAGEDHVKEGELLDCGVHSVLPNVKSVVLADHLNMFVIQECFHALLQVGIYKVRLHLSSQEEFEQVDLGEEGGLGQEDYADISENPADLSVVVQQVELAELVEEVEPEALVEIEG
ncbi:LOW QUALITY PROTEIN: hypothetical protein TorRG33x02_258600 [Trema orientale]|uniref:Uncharacterized protein n=1 Tax=Trema orientale TaxID=63057 RepID=A0A2P5D8N7_TREOI|nr:LOW QUALITY PROTEIN: hypothetical protein TorRG33x02_258600 [Trema orientale]